MTTSIQISWDCIGNRERAADFAIRRAAWLIEATLSQRLGCGVAEVTGQHANFIVDTGQVTAEDVLSLIANIQ
ncbi:hypothetical protein [Paenibacillus sp. SYP-B4298]|uniref:hypothetical protein n=1 Tax=Paenibacillus sp. SYP-B4298 TaxID=2996034 RepID=UPI0022DE827E|nr:hypothetical protein [Paenibacillus sp. SYP-B4298]